MLESIYYKKDKNKIYAAYALGVMYMEGDGVAQDDASAYMWMAIPAHDHPPAEVVERFKKLQGRLEKKIEPVKRSTVCTVSRQVDFSGADKFEASVGEKVIVFNHAEKFDQAIFPDRWMWGYISPACLIPK